MVCAEYNIRTTHPSGSRINIIPTYFLYATKTSVPYVIQCVNRTEMMAKQALFLSVTFQTLSCLTYGRINKCRQQPPFRETLACYPTPITGWLLSAKSLKYPCYIKRLLVFKHVEYRSGDFMRYGSNSHDAISFILFTFVKAFCIIIKAHHVMGSLRICP